MGRRGHHEGSIYQRSDGRWVAAMTVKDHFGRSRRMSRYAPTRTEARKLLKELQKQVDEGIQFPQQAMTLGAFLDQWLEASVKPSVRQKTYEGYESITRVRVKPRIGHLKLTQVTPLVIQQLYRDLQESGLSARSVVHTHRALHRAFHQAVRWGLMSRNPTEGAEPPRAERNEMTVLTRTQVETLLAGTTDHPYRALYILAVTTGMRLGELLGLHWENIDLDRGRLWVRQTLQRQRGRGLVFTEPKTARARRTIMLSKLAVQALREHRTRQLEQRLLVGSEWNEQGLVFTDEFGEPRDPSVHTVTFQRVIRDLGLPRIRFHDLRHTAATLLLGQDVHPKVVSEMLGHATVALTLDTYSHLVPALHERAADQMDELFGS